MVHIHKNEHEFYCDKSLCWLRRGRTAEDDGATRARERDHAGIAARTQRANARATRRRERTAALLVCVRLTHVHPLCNKLLGKRRPVASVR